MSPYTLAGRDEPREEAEASSYEDYTRKYGNYDKTREPVGTERKMPVRRIPENG